jgi:hypothetical protein
VRLCHGGTSGGCLGLGTWNWNLYLICVIGTVFGS